MKFMYTSLISLLFVIVLIPNSFSKTKTEEVFESFFGNAYLLSERMRAKLYQPFPVGPFSDTNADNVKRVLEFLNIYLTKEEIGKNLEKAPDAPDMFSFLKADTIGLLFTYYTTWISQDVVIKHLKASFDDFAVYDLDLLKSNITLIESFIGKEGIHSYMEGTLDGFHILSRAKEFRDLITFLQDKYLNHDDIGLLLRNKLPSLARCQPDQLDDILDIIEIGRISQSEGYLTHEEVVLLMRGDLLKSIEFILPVDDLRKNLHTIEKGKGKKKKGYLSSEEIGKLIKTDVNVISLLGLSDLSDLNETLDIIEKGRKKGTVGYLSHEEVTKLMRKELEAFFRPDILQNTLETIGKPFFSHEEIAIFMRDSLKSFIRLYEELEQVDSLVEKSRNLTRTKLIAKIKKEIARRLMAPTLRKDTNPSQQCMIFSDRWGKS